MAETEWDPVDAAFGRAWRRVIAGAPDMTPIVYFSGQRNGTWYAALERPWREVIANAVGPTPTDALNTLADKLEQYTAVSR